MPNVSSDAVGLFFIVALICAALGVISFSSLPRALKAIVGAGLALRVLGALARYGVMVGVYDGVGDAVRYYREGLVYAERFRLLDFSPLWDSAQWHSQTWWGTQFMFFPSGLVLSLIGPTMLGEFIIFSLFAFLGLVCFVVAFHRAFPDAPIARYAAWLLLFPSLWFWPSSVGKESITLLGVGLATLGFVGRHGRMRLVPLVLGLLLVFSIRPQVVSVLVGCAALAQWGSLRGKWSMGRIAQGIAILAIGLTVVWYSGRELGIASFDSEGLEGYVSSDAARRVGGGSGIDAVTIGLSGAPIAVINVLFRPFPWEADNAMILFSSVEIAGLWLLLWWRRRNVIAALRQLHSSRFIALTLAFIVFYSAALGMMMSNLAIIARQRIFLFPFLFLLMEAVPAVRRARGSRQPLAQCHKPESYSWEQPRRGAEADGARADVMQPAHSHNKRREVAQR